MDSLSLLFDSSGELQVFWRLVLAATLGGLIGIEREIHGRPAGFRTHLLVTVGACLMMVVSEAYYFKYGMLAADSVVRLDPSRVAAQIVTGIGFLGAGAIIKDGHAVRGLTTAACLWVAAGIGMAVGVGIYLPALFVTALALFNLLFLKRVERMFRSDQYRTLIITCDDSDDVLHEVEQCLADQNLRIINFGFEKDILAGEVRYDFIVAQCEQETRDYLIKALSDCPPVRKIRFH
jgi:putative Mg2+ transporter-C (MgtC) family protein